MILNFRMPTSHVLRLDLPPKLSGFSSRGEHRLRDYIFGPRIVPQLQSGKSQKIAAGGSHLVSEVEELRH